MKKMLFICAAVLTASIASAVESANIVGYLKAEAPEGGVFFTTGPTFIQVLNPTNYWRLGDIKVEGMDSVNGDSIMLLNPDDGDVSLMATYVEATGWWDVATDANINDNMYPASLAFLCYLSEPDNVTFVYAGEVLTGPTTVDLSGQMMPFIANLVPAEITLGDITATGVDSVSGDSIMFLDPVDANVITMATYVPATGWWDIETDQNINGKKLLPGAAFLGYFTGPSVTMTFPDPLTLVVP